MEDKQKHKHFGLVHHPPQQPQQATEQQQFLNPEVPSTTATGGRIPGVQLDGLILLSFSLSKLLIYRVCVCV
jgi:hypothetical protein